MGWLDPGCDKLEQVFAQTPQLLAEFDEFRRGIAAQKHVPAATLALCEQRLRQLLGDRDAASLPDTLSPSQQAALDFTEVYCQDPAAITDAQAAAVVAHYGDAGLIALVQALGIYNGLCRLAQLFEVDGQFNHA